MRRNEKAKHGREKEKIKERKWKETKEIRLLEIYEEERRKRKWKGMRERGKTGEEEVMRKQVRGKGNTEKGGNRRGNEITREKRRTKQ